MVGLSRIQPLGSSLSFPQQARTIQIPPRTVVDRSPPDAWDVLRTEVARGATCVVGVPLPAPAEPPPAMTAALDDRERARAARLRVPEDRSAYIVAHYLLARSVRALTYPSRASWSFEPAENGKPRLLVDSQTLHASLSHTRGAVAVAIGRVAPVGVDVEEIKPNDDLARLAHRVLSERERRAVFDDTDPIGMFTRLWTRKEALAKAFGVGLRVPFDRIDVLDPAAPVLPPELSGAIALGDVPCSGPHRLSVALRGIALDAVSFEIPFDLLAAAASEE